MSDFSKPPLILVDGSGYIFRAYYALPPLTRPDGTPVGAVYGFTSMLMRLLEKETEDGIAIIFDAGRKTFRNDIYPEYKAHRPPPPEDLIPQFPLMRQAVEAFSLPAIDLVGYEADDLIATYTRLSLEEKRPVKIISGDKDLMQLIKENVIFLDPIKNKNIGKPEVLEKFGVEPAKVGEVLALMGDSSDNIPGVPGIGPKSAAVLIQKFGTVENLLNHLEEVTKPAQRKNLEENKEQALLSKKLVALCEEVPLPKTIEELHVHPFNLEKAIAFLKEQGFHSLIPRCEKYAASLSHSKQQEQVLIQKEKVSGPVYRLIQTEQDLIAYLEKAKKTSILAVDTETTSLDPLQAELVGVSLCCEDGEAVYIPVGHVFQGTLLDKPSNTLQLSRDFVCQQLKPLLEERNIKKIGHNIKYDKLVLEKYGLILEPYEDTMVLSYVLDGAKTTHGLDVLASTYFNHKTISYKEVTGEGKKAKNFAEVSLDEACTYSCEDAWLTFQLYELLNKRLKTEGLEAVYEGLDLPCVDVLCAMELRGVYVDPKTLQYLSTVFAQQLQALEEEIHQLAGRSFNIASPKQLSEVLFAEQGFSGTKKGKSGDFSTRANILEDLAAEGHLLPLKILAWRQIAKLKSTYTDALINQINPLTHRVHTSYSQTTTSTGRLSSSNPNLQNIPVRTEEGRSIRKAFMASNGKKLLSLDYSQIELRLLAHMADIPSLKQAFWEGKDIHAITASEIFHIPLQDIDKEWRRRAKAINFGIIYGISPFGLAAQINSSREEAKEIIQRYFKTYPGIEAYMTRTKEEARKKGYVETLFGRRCFIPGIYDKNGQTRAFAERQAINAPLQGTASDIIKKAMLLIEEDFSKRSQNMPWMILQVHDELVFEGKEEILVSYFPFLKQTMEKVISLSIPLIVDASIGNNWGEIVPIIKG